MAAAKILIVDDDAMMLGMVYRMLNRRNYDVVSASSPRQAVEIVRTCLFVDVVISDFYMPVMTGGELIHEITRISPQTSAVLMTGSTIDVTDVPRGVPVLKKPFIRAELLPTVEAVLVRSAQLRADLRLGIHQNKQLRFELSNVVRASRNSRECRLQKEKQAAHAEAAAER